jgi:4-hydroxy-tetrahydrodipicolinate reductase
MPKPGFDDGSGIKTNEETSTEMARICLCGATGHVGRELIKAIVASEDLELTAAVGVSSAGKRLPDAVGFDCPELVVAASVEQACGQGSFSVVIDYTTPAAVFGNVTAAIAQNKHCVIGTSGLDDSQYEEIDALAAARRVGVLAAGNFSITSALMQHFAVAAARYVPHWELFDYGTESKIDAPSGTTRELAYRLAQVGPSRHKVPPDQVHGLPASRGAGLNGSQVHAVRLPGFYSSSEIILGLPGERLTLRHDSMSYQPYVAGTLLAARKVHSFIGLKRGLDQLLDFSS